MKYSSMKLFVVPVLAFFILAMSSFTVAKSYAANSKYGVGLVPFKAQSINADEAAKLILSKNAAVVDLRNPYTFTLFNVSDDSANVGVEGFLGKAIEGSYSGMPVVGIVDAESQGSVRQALSAFSPLLGGVQLFLTELNPQNVQEFEKAGLSVNTFENLGLDELPEYANITKNIAQIASLADVQAALDQAIQNTTPATVSALDQAIFEAYTSGVLPFQTYAEMAAAVSGYADKNDLQGALNQLQQILNRAAAPAPSIPAQPQPAPLPGEGVVPPAPAPSTGQLTPPPVPTPVAPAPEVSEEEVVPPVPAPEVSEEEVVPPVPAPIVAPQQPQPASFDQEALIASITDAINKALARPSEENVAALEDALEEAHASGAISDSLYNQLQQLLDSLMGTSGNLQASYNQILQALNEILAALQGEGEAEVVPPVAQPSKPEKPEVDAACVNKAYSIVRNYPGLEDYDVHAMITDIVASQKGKECRLYPIVAKFNKKVEPIYSAEVSKGLFPNLLHRRDILNYDKALDDGLRQAALMDNLITEAEANMDKRLDNLFRRQDLNSPIELGSRISKYITLWPRAVMIRMLIGHEGIDALGNALDDLWNRGIDFPTGRKARR